jgi:uncharacterized protein
MNNQKIIIAGGTGFIGQAMAQYFGKENDIVILTRHLKNTANNAHGVNLLDKNKQLRIKYVQCDGLRTGNWAAELNGAHLLVNLAGKSVNCRYNKKNKEEILRSRVDAVHALGAAIRECTQPPKCWINASSATIYRHATDHAQNEFNGEMHHNFSVEVCKAWEAALEAQRTPFTRKIALRMAINLGPGGILIPYFNLLKFGLGGKQGSGQQMYSWIHIEDTCRIINWLFENKEAEGVYNASSPNPVPNKEFMRLLRKATGYHFGLPAYTWMLKLGGWLIGTEPELVLKSRWVVPARLLQEGFTFKYPVLEDAFRQIIGELPKKQYHLF